MHTPLAKRTILSLLMAAFVLTGCGAFGGEDEQASTQVPEVVESTTVRVASGDRFFDIDPSSLVDASGEPTTAAADTLAERVAGLSAGTAEPTNAGVVFDGDEFVLNPAISGSTPDIDGLLVALTTQDIETLDLPFTSIPAEVSNDDASAYAAELNERISGGIGISVGGQQNTLPGSVVGAATTVEWLDGEWVVSVDYTGIANEVEAMFEDVGSEGGEASFRVVPGNGDDPATVEIVPGTPGTVCCDSEASANRLARALTSNSDTVVLSLAPTDGERGVQWAQDLGITELVGSFSTRYTPGQDRTLNIQRIAEITQGHIIEPGETWSLNERVGQRTTAKGFVPAGTIVNGHLTDSVGGGISQFATTIFNAAFFAGLEFDSYQAHTIYFSRYPYGREATISWPAPQLEIHNPTPYGILIWPTTTSNSITVDLYSTKWVDAEQTGQFENTVQVACTRVTTERTRTFLDGTVDVDTVFAIYREEGIGCDGEPTDDPDAPPETTTTTIPQDGDPQDGDPQDGDPEEGADGGETPTAPTPTDPDADGPQPADPAPPATDPTNADTPAQPEPTNPEPAPTPGAQPPAEPEPTTDTQPPATEPDPPPAPDTEPAQPDDPPEPPAAEDLAAPATNETAAPATNEAA